MPIQPPGRGTSLNPANRYETLHVETDPDEPIEHETIDEPTQFYRDTSRTVLAENASPDVGFRFSLNPYRGCEHGCSYCLAPGTPVLHADMVWRPIGTIAVGDTLVGFDEYATRGATRKFRKAVVEAVWWSRRRTLRMLTDRTEVSTTAEHRWLQHRNFRWSRTDRLSPGRMLRYIPVVADEEVDDDFRVGYLTGLTLGDGTFRYQPGWRSDKLGFPAAYWRVALADDEPLSRAVEQLGHLGVAAAIRPFYGGPTSRRPMQKVEIRSLRQLATIHAIVTVELDTRSYRRGFLAGFFDAEGHSGDSLRFAQVDLTVLERVRRYAASLGFTCTLEPRPNHASTLRLKGTLLDRIRFFSTCRPVITRKMHALFGREMNLDGELVRAIEPGPFTDVVDIQTSTGTFLAAGLATHNCYARPSHEYLGFSAGLDFERRIMVKEDAPELLRATFRSPRWKPEVVALSGNTDCYQPVERRLGITRRCVEVFAAFRNPVSVITKSALVARDADLFAALAEHQAVHVMCSLTTLDGELARRLEPRAATPERRLDAIRTLTRAGVPVGVMVAPVIPGLNDSEIPRILAAAAEAGAVGAGWVLLRLAAPLDRIFDDWLATHYPDRRDRVLNRIRETRGGRISDSRFGHRMRGTGQYAEQLAALFAAAARKHRLDRPFTPLSVTAFRRPASVGDQLRLL